MKTVGEFKKAGLVFVKGDDGVDFCVYNQETMNADSMHDDSNVESFAWRENTGVKPEFSGYKELELKNGEIKLTSTLVAEDDLDWSILGDGTDIAKWRPSLNQPLIAEPETKESATHKAWVALGGSIRLDFQDANSIWHVSGASYVNGEYYFSSTESCFESDAKLVCTVKEFTDYCEKMAAEEKRMDIIGQNGNDGLHYDNTAQQVESLAVNDKPIFTQAMVDAGELPPVGSTVIFDAELANDFEYEYENGLSDGDKVDIIAHLDTGKSVAAVFSYSISRGKLVSQGGFGCFKPVGTRTDREKAIDEAMADIDAERDDHANVAGVVERMIAAGYSKC